MAREPVRASGYTGPFAVSVYSPDELAINPGHVFAGDWAEYGYEGEILDLSGIIPFDVEPSGPVDTTLHIYLPVEVDPVNGRFTTPTYLPASASYAYIGSPGFRHSPDNDPGNYSDDWPHAWRILASVGLTFETVNNPDPTPDTYIPNINYVWQRQYGDIHMPVFVSWGVNSIGGDRWHSIDDAEYVAGWQHGHFMGRPILDVPGIDTVRVSMSAPSIENGYNGALIDRQWPFPPAAASEDYGDPKARAGNQYPA